MTPLRLVATSSARPWLGTGACRPESSERPVDLLVDGMNLTARLEQGDPVPLLAGLVDALSDLWSGQRNRATLSSLGQDGAWEIDLERDASRVLFSLYRGGRRPEVAVFERAIQGAELRAAVEHALDQSLASLPAESAASGELASARRTLATLEPPGAGPSAPPFVVAVGPEGDAPLQFFADLVLRERGDEPRGPGAQRADLFSLLRRGSLRVRAGASTREIGEVFVFAVVEELIELAREALDMQLAGCTVHRRAEVCGVVVGVRHAPPGEAPNAASSASASDPADAEVWLTLGRRGGAARSWTFPVAGARVLAEAVVAFGRALARTFLRHNPAHRYNLRLMGFRDSVRKLAEQVRELSREDAKVNPTPEAYRLASSRSDARDGGTPAPIAAPPGAGTASAAASRIRYSQRWTATIAGLELRSTFLCGDRLVLGAGRETVCLDRASGELLWRRATPTALSVVTPAGLARIQADGTVTVLDFGTGEPILRARLAPRSGASAAGAVVHGPGLPRLLVTTEGERHLSALDLRTGEVRWRHAARRGELFRLRRAGKLLVVAAADPTLTALDVQSGDVIWRVRGRFRFCQQPGLDHDALFAVAGETIGPPRGRLQLYHLDAYAGHTRWVRDLPADLGVPCQPPLATSGTVVLVTRDRRGLGLCSFDRATGAPLWSQKPGFLSLGSAALAVDDELLVNTDGGELLGMAAQNGKVLFRHAFARGLDGDQPRRLEPVLRSGALFVPQQAVHVVRPRDGALLGRIETEIIPDLMRVDERCDVFVAEESGHIAWFQAGPRLAVV